MAVFLFPIAISPELDMPKRKAATLPANSSPSRRSVARPRPPKQHAGDTDTAINKNARQQQPEPAQAAPNSASVVHLAQVAAVIPAENLQQLATAVQSGRWLFAVWHVAEGRLHLERTATNFPTVDLEKSVAMLAENLKELSQPS